jgi:hypothetical protein
MDADTRWQQIAGDTRQERLTGSRRRADQDRVDLGAQLGQPLAYRLPPVDQGLGFILGGAEDE